MEKAGNRRCAVALDAKVGFVSGAVVHYIHIAFGHAQRAVGFSLFICRFRLRLKPIPSFFLHRGMLHIVVGWMGTRPLAILGDELV